MTEPALDPVALDAAKRAAWLRALHLLAHTGTDLEIPSTLVAELVTVAIAAYSKDRISCA